jgi:hypothetical protein
MLTPKPPLKHTHHHNGREKLQNGRWELRCSLTNQGKENFDTLKEAWEKRLGKPLTQSKFLDYFFDASAKSITKGTTNV